MISSRLPDTKNAGPWSKKVTHMILYAVAREMAKKVLANDRQVLFSGKKPSLSAAQIKKYTAGR